ncbi:MAG: hypothetical protein CMM52_07170 [Rhodospirillaceae bacterium]|nr:hypothetical protein [Rhodospirillaceae bacterium]|tara:strand:+ start:34499 stop:34837 length:339 start_codon:yes stop_codon:yes gene_type:complete
MTGIAELNAELEQASGVINAFRDHAAQGNGLDLSDLDAKIKALCETIVELPPSERQAFKAKLISLTDDLDRLVETLTKQHREIAEDIQSVTSRQRAASAYGSAGTTTSARKK